jgi:hypothetical protein
MYSKYSFVGFSFVGWPLRSVCSLWQQLKSSIFDGSVLSLFHCHWFIFCILVFILQNYLLPNATGRPWCCLFGLTENVNRIPPSRVHRPWLPLA